MRSLSRKSGQRATLFLVGEPLKVRGDVVAALNSEIADPASGMFIGQQARQTKRPFTSLLWISALLLTCVYGCGGTPTSASTTPAPPVSNIPSPPTPPSPRPPVLALECSEVVNGYQCHASVVNQIDGTQRDITGLVKWSTSDPKIATVNSVGFVTALASGDVAIRVNYNGEDNFLPMTVRPGGANYYFKALSGWTTDASNGTKIPGVDVRILDGPNANRMTSSGPDGAYQMYELAIGTFTVRFSKAGYLTLDRTAFLSGDNFTGLDAQLMRAP
jgi:hypothetical protein